MANLKDLIVNGTARIIGKTYSSEFVGNVTGNLTGNAATSSKLKTARSLKITDDGTNTSTGVDFDGSDTVTLKLPSTIKASLAGNASTATTADKTAYGISVKDSASNLAVNGWNGSAAGNLTIAGTSPITTTATGGKITVSHDNSTVTAGTYKSVTVDAKGHVTAGTNPTTLSDYGITDAKIASGVITLGSNTITPLTSASTLAASKVSGTLATSNIPNLDASKITSGTIDVERLPATALERCVVVADDAARFALTTASVQVGDTVKVTDTKKMYMVVNSSKLDDETGYEEYFTSTDWSTITNKPNFFSKVTVGSDTIEADTETDTLTLVAGDNITLTPDATNDKVTIKATDTTYTVASGDSNGHIKVTPSSGDAYDVPVRGLNTAAYRDVDTSPASGSTNVITSGGVYAVIGDINAILDNINGEVV